MSDRKNPASGWDDLICIWMKSDVVDYKLCDKEFDCDNCWFFHSIHNKGINGRIEDDNYSVVIRNLVYFMSEKLEEFGIDFKHGLMLSLIHI